jgi:hypothetical protein
LGCRVENDLLFFSPFKSAVFTVDLQGYISIYIKRKFIFVVRVKFFFLRGAVSIFAGPLLNLKIRK